MKSSIQELLSPEEYLAYELRFSPTAKSKPPNLSVEDAKAAWQMRREAEHKARVLRADSGLPAAKRETALAAVRQEAEASIRDLYGDRGWRHYAGGSGANWLDEISH